MVLISQVSAFACSLSVDVEGIGMVKVAAESVHTLRSQVNACGEVWPQVVYFFKLLAKWHLGTIKNFIKYMVNR